MYLVSGAFSGVVSAFVSLVSAFVSFIECESYKNIDFCSYENNEHDHEEMYAKKKISCNPYWDGWLVYVPKQTANSIAGYRFEKHRSVGRRRRCGKTISMLWHGIRELSD